MMGHTANSLVDDLCTKIAEVGPLVHVIAASLIWFLVRRDRDTGHSLFSK